MEKKEVIFLVIFLAYWVFSFLAKKFMPKQDQEQAETKGFTLRVLEFIASFKESSENEQNRIGPQMNAQPQVEIQQVPLTVKKEEYVAPTAVRRSAMEQHLKSSATPPMKQAHKKTTVLPKSPVVAQMEKRAGRKFPKQKLRDAIIWSEIIGKPVALRDN